MALFLASLRKQNYIPTTGCTKQRAFDPMGYFASQRWNAQTLLTLPKTSTSIYYLDLNLPTSEMIPSTLQSSILSVPSRFPTLFSHSYQCTNMPPPSLWTALIFTPFYRKTPWQWFSVHPHLFLPFFLESMPVGLLACHSNEIDLQKATNGYASELF